MIIALKLRCCFTHIDLETIFHLRLNITIMKKGLLLTLLIAFRLVSNAQTVTLAVITPPCDSNGVVVATFTGMATPYRVVWQLGASYVIHYGVTGTTDTLHGFAGGFIQMFGQDTTATTVASDTATFSPPFWVKDSAINGICPASTGMMAASILGGTGPFTYEWID
jgi:hypothetical protein